MIHQYKNNGYNIVLDVNSGSVHVVDDVAYDVISMYEEKGKEEITKIICKEYCDEWLFVFILPMPVTFPAVTVLPVRESTRATVL